MINSTAGKERPKIIGEVLFDRFPDGSQSLGGAPFNVAWHLQGFGVNPLFVSCVGDDAEGELVRDAMAAWGMDQSGIRTDHDHPTGVVDIEFSGSEHSFDILADQAYDYISGEQLNASVLRDDTGLIYQGSLIMRTGEVRQSLARLLERTEAPLFVDINLREPWWRSEDFPRLLNRAKWLKVNDEELEIIARELKLSGADLITRAINLRESLSLKLLVLTLGSQGAVALQAGAGPINIEPAPADKVIDTVGAGDAFASVSLLGLLYGWPITTILERAQQFASRIVQQRGATTEDREMYERLQMEWGVA